MSTIWVVLLSVIGGVVLILSAIAFYCNLFCSRSLISCIVEIYLRVTVKRISDKRVKQGISKLPQKNDVPYRLPRLTKFSVKYSSEDFFGMKVYYLGNKQATSAIMYLHGGGYVRQPRFHHWKFLNKLAKKSNNLVVVPIYPKAPNHGPIESYDVITRLYTKLISKFSNVSLMGDSSGGGLAAGLCQSFYKKNLPQPYRLVLLSPWVDLSLNNPDIPFYEKKDPLIWALAERIWGACWAKDLALTNPIVSPIYGELVCYQNVYLFVGTREMLYPDVVCFYKKLKKAEVNVSLIVGEGMNHVYPIYPIPEAKKAFAQILDIINKKGDNI